MVVLSNIGNIGNIQSVALLTAHNLNMGSTLRLHGNLLVQACCQISSKSISLTHSLPSLLSLPPSLPPSNGPRYRSGPRAPAYMLTCKVLLPSTLFRLRQACRHAHVCHATMYDHKCMVWVCVWCARACVCVCARARTSVSVCALSF